jgi:hypothetical protein
MCPGSLPRLDAYTPPCDANQSLSKGVVRRSGSAYEPTGMVWRIESGSKRLGTRYPRSQSGVTQCVEPRRQRLRIKGMLQGGTHCVGAGN